MARTLLYLSQNTLKKTTRMPTMNTMTLKMAPLQPGQLREQLDPTFLRTLKKRLIKGQISPGVFKKTLKRMMVAHFFNQYRHPVEELGRKIKAILFIELKFSQRQPESDLEPPYEIEGYLAVPRSKNMK